MTRPTAPDPVTDGFPVVPVAAGAQLQIESLPGDPPGDKTAFHYARAPDVEGAFWLDIGRAGHRASHVVGLTRTRSGAESALDQATHSVRWHHKVTPGGGYYEGP